jgi:hypothetical protein
LSPPPPVSTSSCLPPSSSSSSLSLLFLSCSFKSSPPYYVSFPQKDPAPLRPNLITVLYSQVIINRCKELARFALMHCIASSLCFWIWTILRETLDSLNSYAKYDDSADDDDSSEEADLFENSVALPLTVIQQSKMRSVPVCHVCHVWHVPEQCLWPFA